MKVRITDLLDQYEDRTVVLDPSVMGNEGSDRQEIPGIRQSRHSFGWRQGLSIAAVLALLILGGFGVVKLLQNRRQSAPTANTVPSVVATDPTDDGEETVITLNDDEQTALNRYLTCLSQQGITNYDGSETSEYELACFCHLYLKINEKDKIQYLSEGDDFYETFTLDQANEVTGRFFGRTLSPKEGTDYTLMAGNNYAVHEQYHDGIFWFPAADGDLHTGFSVCDTVRRVESGDLSVSFTVYDVNDIDNYYDKFETVYTRLRIPEAEDLVGSGELFKTMHGSALLRPAEDGWTLLSYEGRVIEVDPGHREDDEEFPQEYPVENYRLSGDVFAQTGELNAYRYESTPMDDGFWVVLHSYAENVLDRVGKLDLVQDSPHDGYANWFMEGPDCSASASGSSITGRFTFSLYPGFSRILELTEKEIDDPDMMKEKATEFTSWFFDTTGELVLDHQKTDVCYYHDERSDELKDVTVPCIIFYFREAAGGVHELESQAGRSVPVLCGDSNVLDLGYHCFSVTVAPDGTVLRADNYISCAVPVLSGTVRMLDESDMPTLMGFMTSFTEHDTVVIESVSADRYSVYFGSANIEPTVTVNYYYESDPEQKQSTEFVLPGLFDDD